MGRGSAYVSRSCGRAVWRVARQSLTSAMPPRFCNDTARCNHGLREGRGCCQFQQAPLTFEEDDGTTSSRQGTAWGLFFFAIRLVSQSHLWPAWTLDPTA